MLPIPKKQKIILAWVVVASFTFCLAMGVSYGRMKEWTSAEILFAPTVSVETENGYSSNCLVAGGQTILLADWASDTAQRTVVMEISRPADPYSLEVAELLEEPEEPEAPEEPEEQEVTLTVNSSYITCEATVAEDTITLLLTRVSPVTEVTEATVHVAWQGLEGTISVKLLPEEATPPQEEVRVISNSLPIEACTAVNREMPLGYFLLDAATETVTFSQSGQTLQMVRCSLDGGQTYTLLYDNIPLPLENVPENWDGMLLVDFSLALAGEQDIIVNAQGGGLSGSCTLTQQSKTPVAPLFWKVSNLTVPISMRTVWGNAAIRLQVQKLQTEENDQLVYLEQDAVTAASTDGAVILRANTQPVPGTYRLVITWIWNEISVEEQIIYFVINTK